MVSRGKSEQNRRPVQHGAVICLHKRNYQHRSGTYNGPALVWIRGVPIEPLLPVPLSGLHEHSDCRRQLAHRLSRSGSRFPSKLKLWLFFNIVNIDLWNFIDIDLSFWSSFTHICNIITYNHTCMYKYTLAYIYLCILWFYSTAYHLHIYLSISYTLFISQAKLKWAWIWTMIIAQAMLTPTPPLQCGEPR